ncbi:MAG: hypothetical protein WCJ54_03325 [Actinomycetota bacterium]|jgi:hypothetical protein
MLQLPISNINTHPLNNINGPIVNVDGSHVSGIPFSNTVVPNGIHTLPPTGTNVQSAAGIYPAPTQKGGKINRKKINKISRKYKMKGSKKTIRKHVRRMKSRVRSRYNVKTTGRRHRHHKTNRRHLKGGTSRHMLFEGTRSQMRGGFQTPMSSVNYPAGHNQYQNNNGSLSNVYSTGGPLEPRLSALANPPIFQSVAGDVDNLNHNTLNAYGNIGAGSGIASRGWF